MELGFEDLGPRGSVAGCLGVEVEFQGLEVVLVVDVVGEVVFLARFAAADEIHFLEVRQVGCRGSKSPCQLRSRGGREDLTISPFPVLAELLDTVSLNKS